MNCVRDHHKQRSLDKRQTTSDFFNFIAGLRLTYIKMILQLRNSSQACTIKIYIKNKTTTCSRTPPLVWRTKRPEPRGLSEEAPRPIIQSLHGLRKIKEQYFNNLAASNNSTKALASKNALEGLLVPVTSDYMKARLTKDSRTRRPSDNGELPRARPPWGRAISPGKRG